MTRPAAHPAPAPSTPTAETPLLRGKAATPMAFVEGIVQACQRRHVDPEPLLRAVQIPPAWLGQAERRVTAAQFETLSAAAMQQLDDEALGWFERPLPWGSYGMLARASLTAPTLGVALRRWCRHHALLTRDITLSLPVHEQQAQVVMAEHRPPGGDGSLREFCHVSVLRNIHGLACWLIDSRIPLRGARFAFAAPTHTHAYQVLFDGPCQFDAPHSAIGFDARYLQLPILRDEAAMQQMLQRALSIQVRPYRRDRLLVQRVRQLLLSQPQAIRNADDLAHRLNTSARSLHRQLQAEGATLQAIKDSVRRERAMALLQRSQSPLKQVAEAAGFQNEKSFIRAFKGWTGTTPGEWRKSL